MRGYKVEIGTENVPLNFYTVEAKNLEEARKIAYGLLNNLVFNEGLFRDYINVKPIRRKK